MTAHPPKPRLALTVGVIGHRPKDLAKDLPPDLVAKLPYVLSPEQRLVDARLAKVAADVAAVLRMISDAALQALGKHKAFFVRNEHGRPMLTLVSALAEGADTIAAEACKEFGYALDAPLPFPREEYKKDFKKQPSETLSPEQAQEQAAAAIERFESLLEGARSVFELPGRHRCATDSKEAGNLKENRAYEAAGVTVLSQADIVLAVWDREASRGRGGTAELVAEAARIGLPIIIVDAYGVLPIEVRWRNLMDNPAPIVAIDDLAAGSLESKLGTLVDELVRPPKAQDQPGLQRWFAECRLARNIRIEYPLLTFLLVVRGIRRADIFPQSPCKLAKEYKGAAAPVLAGETDRQIDLLAQSYGWADAIASYFAQVFRSAFVMNFLFAALAVVFASASVMIPIQHAPEPHAILSRTNIPVIAEIVLIAFVVANTGFGLRRHWHRRWVEAREIAERLRVALPLWALGLRPAFFTGEEPTWTGWYARAIVRMQGLRNGNLAASGTIAERAVLHDLLAGQCNYNHADADRMRRIERRLERIGILLLAATFVVAFDHLFDGPVVRWSLGWLLPSHEATIWLSAALPALATASYGIRVIGDFEGRFHRAERTYKRLNQLVAALKQDPQDFALLRARAYSAADALLGDVSSWRLSAESRGLAIPG